VAHLLTPEKDGEQLRFTENILVSWYFFVVYKFNVNCIHYTNVASGLKIKSDFRLKRKLVELLNKVFIDIWRESKL
jgi:hypothetical protein